MSEGEQQQVTLPRTHSAQPPKKSIKSLIKALINYYFMTKHEDENRSPSDKLSICIYLYRGRESIAYKCVGVCCPLTHFRFLMGA